MTVSNEGTQKQGPPGEALVNANVEDAEYIIKLLPGGNANGYKVLNVESVSGGGVKMCVKQMTGQQKGSERYLYPFGLSSQTRLRVVEEETIRSVFDI